MKIRRRGVSSNIEDRRGQSSGLGRGLQIGGGGGILAIVALVASFCVATQGGGSGGGGFDLTQILTQLQQVQVEPGATNLPQSSPEEEALVEFVSFVLDDVQAVWADQFAASGQEYRPATLVLFRGSTQTACGVGSAQMGPFYCPGDEKVYLDLNFFEQLASRFGAPGDFAQAYVIAHEIGHHLQHITGLSDEVRRLERADPENANELSIRQELQADCLAGVWASSVYERGLLETGDIEEGLQAATVVGDDYIQEELGGGTVNPDTWTHGSSEQRVDWFTRGFDSGNTSNCDTFAVSDP